MQFKKDPQFHIWPKATLAELTTPFFQLKKATASDVESRLTEIFPGRFPVFFSSGRSGLLACLTALEATRNDLVWVPPFSSHCVWSTVGALGTPTTSLSPKPKIALAYHQWGYAQKFKRQDMEFIEDSVDSLCDGTSSLAPNEGRYELFSLPKITASAFGGFVLCRERADQERLRNIRSKGQNFSITHHLRRMAQNYSMQDYLYWSNTDAFNGPVPSLLCQDALAALSRWSQLIADRRRKIALLKEFALEPIQENTTRLPSCLLLADNEPNTAALKNCGFELGKRTRIYTENDEIVMTTVLPVPLHTQIPLQSIECLANTLGAIEKP